MAKLPTETSETIWNLLRQLVNIVEDAGEAESILFDRFGETENTMSNLEDLRSVALEAASRYSQLSSIRLRVAEAQPTTSDDMLRSLNQVLAQNQLRIPAMERSIQEIEIEWNLP